ncbi:energy transducer TonB [Pelomonas sp. SE-A7]|uniref:energy transducer TonB n=1 Tax=Pelomonas sp. SE-A7 TaxID=3054953 RepID=UPI00259CFFAB|nr:energy transducer TonB [Pelomonas sp. SE-A7]MDM4767250.1 energy transducer TonB [Pelomonas sp. SE-A7]
MQAVVNQPWRTHLAKRCAVALIGALLAVGAIAAPKVIKKVPPEFPREAAQKGIANGSVKAELTIGADGTVTDVKILEAEPKRVFDKAVIAALKEWKYEGTGEKQTAEVKLVFRNED